MVAGLHCERLEVSNEAENKRKKKQKDQFEVTPQSHSWKGATAEALVPDKLHLSCLHSRFYSPQSLSQAPHPLYRDCLCKTMAQPPEHTKQSQNRSFTGRRQIKVPLNNCHSAHLISTNSPLSEKQTHSGWVEKKQQNTTQSDGVS